MHAYRRLPRGIIFISLLATSAIILMVVGAFLKLNQSGLFHASHFRDSLRAEQAARGGLNHLLAILESDNEYHQDLQGSAGENAVYSASFRPSNPDYCVNNLGGTGDSARPSSVGRRVPAGVADLVVTGQCGLARRRIHVQVQRGFSSARSVAAVGKVNLSGDVVVDGVKSLIPPYGLAQPEPAPGGILSKYRSKGPQDHAISWDDATGVFELGELSRLEAAPAISGGAPISASLASRFPEQVVEDGAADTVPDLDVAGRVSAAAGSPPPDGLRPSGSAYSLSTTFVWDQRYVQGDLHVMGDLVLSEGTLYVAGDLHLDGGIEGLGSIFVSGDVTMRGGNTVLQTSQPSGAALLAGGEVQMTGLDAEGYLHDLAEANPAVRTAFDAMMPELERYHNNGPALDYRGTTGLLAKTTHPAAPGPEAWVSPIPGPNGSHSLSYSDGLLPALILAIDDPATVSPDSARTAKVVGALEEMQFHFRHSLETVSPFVTPNGSQVYRIDDEYRLEKATATGWDRLNLAETRWEMQNTWDDSSLPYSSWTHDHIRAYLGSPLPHIPPNERPETLEDGRRKAFINNHPLDFSWLGESAFQGIVYARGGITVDQRFKVVGSLISLEDINLTNGAKLIFNEEYRDVFGQRLPVAVTLYEEL